MRGGGSGLGGSPSSPRIPPGAPAPWQPPVLRTLAGDRHTAEACRDAGVVTPQAGSLGLTQESSPPFPDASAGTAASRLRRGRVHSFLRSPERPPGCMRGVRTPVRSGQATQQASEVPALRQPADRAGPGGRSAGTAPCVPRNSDVRATGGTAAAPTTGWLPGSRDTEASTATRAAGAGPQEPGASPGALGAAKWERP